ncbi:hypothetical protein [Dickeya sp. NCPPB 3274]|uniref:hypothetical protein n=1 Tax=Dickeya sp. NCPPB 3274 TaxID=568766 RepID=UPI0005B33F94|nr:hypothetical protein [Dickeya sp. NCPPB 3274]
MWSIIPFLYSVNLSLSIITLPSKALFDLVVLAIFHFSLRKLNVQDRFHVFVIFLFALGITSDWTLSSGPLDAFMKVILLLITGLVALPSIYNTLFDFVHAQKKDD